MPDQAQGQWNRAQPEQTHPGCKYIHDPRGGRQDHQPDNAEDPHEIYPCKYRLLAVSLSKFAGTIAAKDIEQADQGQGRGAMACVQAIISEVGGQMKRHERGMKPTYE